MDILNAVLNTSLPIALVLPALCVLLVAGWCIKKSIGTVCSMLSAIPLTLLLGTGLVTGGMAGTGYSVIELAGRVKSTPAAPAPVNSVHLANEDLVRLATNSFQEQQLRQVLAYTRERDDKVAAKAEAEKAMVFCSTGPEVLTPEPTPRTSTVGAILGLSFASMVSGICVFRRRSENSDWIIPERLRDDDHI